MGSLGGNQGHSGPDVWVALGAVEPNLPVITLLGSYVAHLDGALCKLQEKFPLAVSKLRHVRLIHPRSVLQSQVAGYHAPVMTQILVVVCIESVGCLEVQICEHKRVVFWPSWDFCPGWTNRLVEEVQEFGVGVLEIVGIAQADVSDDCTFDSANCVCT